MKNLNETIEQLYQSYVENATGDDNAQEARLSGMSAAVDTATHTGRGIPSDELLASYEEAARRAGYYAGFRAALELIQGTTQQ